MNQHRFVMRTMAAALLALGGAVGAAQEAAKGEEGTRQLWDEAFLESRPKAPAAAAVAKRPRASRPAAPAGPAYVGVTLWRLKPASAGTRAVTVAGEGRSWEPERSEVDATLPEGQHVRLSVEVSRPGYLYVIDRERFADGSLGEPTLIFPTRRLRGGDNAMQPGRVVEIPDLQDQPPYFTLKRSRPEHVEEELLLLVTPEPLRGLGAGADAAPLTREQVAEWERRWGARHRKLELAGGAGRGYTEAERAAASTSSRLLTRAEPLPQTLYRVEGAGAEPTLVTVTLRIGPAR